MSQLAIKNLKTDDRIKTLNLKNQREISGGMIFIFYEDGSIQIIDTPLEGTFDFTQG
jgi:ribosomal protein S4E